jgi:hypothetical protein
MFRHVHWRSLMSALADFPHPEFRTPGSRAPGVAGEGRRHSRRHGISGVSVPTRSATDARSAAALLRQARHGLAAAEWEAVSGEKFSQAYLAALRGAAAVLVLHGRPHRGRARPTSAWVLLGKVAPEMSEWAGFFAAHSATSAAVQAGINRSVTPRSADDLARQTAQFLSIVARTVDERQCGRRSR